MGAGHSRPLTAQPQGAVGGAALRKVYDFQMFRPPAMQSAALRSGFAVRRRSPRHALAGAALVSALLLGACGGGVSFGFGSGAGFDDSPPSISLAASAASVVAGQTLVLVAAAADENGIDAVIFYRIDPGEQRPLGTLTRPPYELNIIAPTDGRQTLRLFARAIDNVGNRADSEVVEIAITR